MSEERRPRYPACSCIFVWKTLTVGQSNQSFSLFLFLMLVVVMSCVVRLHVRACREEIVRVLNVSDACERPAIQMFLFGSRLAMWGGAGSKDKFVEIVFSCHPVVMSMALSFVLQPIIFDHLVRAARCDQASSLLTGIPVGLVEVAPVLPHAFADPRSDRHEGNREKFRTQVLMHSSCVSHFGQVFLCHPGHPAVRMRRPLFIIK